MTGDGYTRKLDELDRLSNDLDVALQPDLIGSLLDEVIREGRANRHSNAGFSPDLTPSG